MALFLAVAQTASVRHAAERLHMSQPPLSRAIRELEQRLGCRLFERSAGGMQLTQAGRALRPYALRMEALLRDAQGAVAAHAQSSPLRLGLTSSVEPNWFRELAGASVGESPGRELRVVSDTSPRLVRRIRGGHLDAACIALPTEAEGLLVQELDRLPMIVVLATSNPLARRRRLRLENLAGEALYWFDRRRQPAFFDHCERVFARHGFAPRRLSEPPDHHVLLSSIVAGRGIALVPSSFAALRRAGVAYRPLVEGDELAVRIGLAVPADRASTAGMLLSCIREAQDRARPSPRPS